MANLIPKGRDILPRVKCTTCGERKFSVIENESCYSMITTYKLKCGQCGHEATVEWNPSSVSNGHLPKMQHKRVGYH